MCVGSRAPALRYSLDEFVLGQAEEGAVREVGNEVLATVPRHAFAASQVEQSEGGQTLGVGQAGVRYLITAWKQREEKKHIKNLHKRCRAHTS